MITLQIVIIERDDKVEIMPSRNSFKPTDGEEIASLILKTKINLGIAELSKMTVTIKGDQFPCETSGSSQTPTVEKPTTPPARGRKKAGSEPPST